MRLALAAVALLAFTTANATESPAKPAKPAATRPAAKPAAKPATKPAAAPAAPTDKSWPTPTRATLTVTGTGALKPAYYDYANQSERERQVEVAYDNPSPGADPIHGTILRINDVLAAENIPTESGKELNAYDAPDQALALARTMLERSTDKKPGTLKETVAVTIVEKSDALEVTSLGGTQRYAAPWTLHGSIDPDGADAVSFDLTLDYAGDTAGKTLSTHLVGRWERSRDHPRFPDSQPLSGWALYAVGGAAGQPATLSRLTQRYANLGALRAGKPSAAPAKPAPKPAKKKSK